MKRRFIWLAIVGFAITLAGCAGTPAYEKAFKGKPRMGNVETVRAPIHTVEQATMKTLSERGFRISGQKEGHITAVNTFQKARDSNKSTTVTADVGLYSLSDDITRVSFVADQKTTLHQTKRTWFHLLFLIPIFPTGVEHSEHVLNAGTINDSQYYRSFFSALKKNV